MPIDKILIIKLSICSRKVARNTHYSTIVIIVNILLNSRTQQVEDVDPCVLFPTLK